MIMCQYKMPDFLSNGVSSCSGLGSGEGFGEEGEYNMGAPRRAGLKVRLFKSI